MNLQAELEILAIRINQIQEEDNGINAYVVHQPSQAKPSSLDVFIDRKAIGKPDIERSFSYALDLIGIRNFNQLLINEEILTVSPVTHAHGSATFKGVAA